MPNGGQDVNATGAGLPRTESEWQRRQPAMEARPWFLGIAVSLQQPRTRWNVGEKYAWKNETETSGWRRPEFMQIDVLCLVDDGEKLFSWIRWREYVQSGWTGARVRQKMVRLWKFNYDKRDLEVLPGRLGFRFARSARIFLGFWFIHSCVVAAEWVLESF